MIFQLKISLNGLQPPIWRRIQVPGDVSLLKLHFIFQVAMGWRNTHLHEFLIRDKCYGTQYDDVWETRETEDEKTYQLDQVVSTKGIHFRYLYDFGDSWEHTIVVEDILEPDEEKTYPTCLDGERACPPEDVGGTWGYQHFMEAITNSNHPEHNSYLTWVGGVFEPEAFDIARIDADLNNINHSELLRVYQRYNSGETGPELKVYQGVSEWTDALASDGQIQLDELPLRRDTVSLLTYLRDHRITGTQSTGNLPLKVIREATTSFVNPPKLELEIGDMVYKIRSEFYVWPVYFIHSLLEVGGLLVGGPGRRLRLTVKGEQFLTAEHPIQVWFLLETWWYHTNWLIAYPFEGIGERLPYMFTLTTLDFLLDLPVERPIPFKDFADQLIQLTGLKWKAQNATHARNSLHNAIESMLINILQDFRVVDLGKKNTGTRDVRSKKLQSFTITKLGRGLLQAVAGGQF